MQHIIETRRSLFNILAVSSAFIVYGLPVMAAADYSRYPYESAVHAARISHSYRGVHDTDLPISLQLGMDPSFSSNQRNLIDLAMRIFIERSLSRHIIDCAYRNSHKDRPSSRDHFEAQVYDALRPIPIGNSLALPSFAFIARYSAEGSVGVGYVNLFYDTDHPFPNFDTRHYLHIALNSDYLGDSANYVFANNADYWAGVIGHEFLHNLGYRHPSGYSGSFIKEYGLCIQSNGSDFDAIDMVEDLEVIREIDGCPEL